MYPTWFDNCSGQIQPSQLYIKMNILESKVLKPQNVDKFSCQFLFFQRQINSHI